MLLMVIRTIELSLVDPRATGHSAAGIISVMLFVTHPCPRKSLLVPLVSCFRPMLRLAHAERRASHFSPRGSHVWIPSQSVVKFVVRLKNVGDTSAQGFVTRAAVTLRVRSAMR